MSQNIAAICFSFPLGVGHGLLRGVKDCHWQYRGGQWTVERWVTDSKEVVRGSTNIIAAA